MLGVRGSAEGWKQQLGTQEISTISNNLKRKRPLSACFFPVNYPSGESRAAGRCRRGFGWSPRATARLRVGLPLRGASLCPGPTHIVFQAHGRPLDALAALRVRPVFAAPSASFAGEIRGAVHSLCSTLTPCSRSPYCHFTVPCYFSFVSYLLFFFLSMAVAESAGAT